MLEGREPAGLLLRQAVERQQRDMARQVTDPAWPYRWSDWHACDVCAFLELLPHVEGRWATPSIHLEPAQVWILTTIFGWRQKDDPHRRRFSMVYIELARKGAKSTLTAGVSLYCLTRDRELGPQIVIGATTGQQALKVFKPAKTMVERTATLRAAFTLEPLAWSIACHENGGSIQPINARASTQDGWNPHVGILDELHAHKTRDLFEVIRTAFGARENALLWMITTAGTDLTGVCYEQRSLVAKILQGLVEADHYFGVIYTLDEGDDPFDEAVWKKANPLLGVTPSLEKLREAALEAKHSPDSLAGFKTKRLNLWGGAASAWLNLAAWDACADTTLRLEDFAGADCWVGGDLSDNNDMTAVVLVFTRDDRWVVFPTFYLPAGLVKQEGRTAHYYAWSQRGLLQLTEGTYIDKKRVEADIRGHCDRFNVLGIRCDQWSPQLVANLANDGYPAAILPKHSKNWTLPAKELETRIKAGPTRFVHPGDPILRWMASNAVVSKRVDGSLLTKKESANSPNKIDGIDALITGASPIVPAEQPPPPKEYQVFVFGGRP